MIPQVLDGSSCAPAVPQGWGGAAALLVGLSPLPSWQEDRNPSDTNPWSPVGRWAQMMCSAEDDFLSFSPLTHPTVASHRFIYCSPRHRNSRAESPCPVPDLSSDSWAGICQSIQAFPALLPWGSHTGGLPSLGAPSAAPRAWLCSGLLTHSPWPWKWHSASRGVLIPAHSLPLGMCAGLLCPALGCAGMLGC